MSKKSTMVSIFAKSMLKVAMEPLNRKSSYWQWFVKAKPKEGSITTSGVLFQDEVWSGEVHITGDVVIPEGRTLTVRAGTTITFTPNSSDNDVGIMTFDLDYYVRGRRKREKVGPSEKQASIVLQKGRV